MGPAAAPLVQLLPRVRALALSHAACAGWPALAEQVERHLSGGPLPLPVILPLAACAAVGGDPEEAVPAAAACALLLLCVRWLDDAHDRDRGDALWAEVGGARATNLAAGALTLAWSALAAAPLPPAVMRAFGDGTLAMGAGQDADLRGGGDPAQCMEAVRGKSGAAYQLATLTGALAGRGRPAHVDACAAYGMHVGLLLQLLDDLEGAFTPAGAGDLACGKATLPVVYALAPASPRADELREVLAAGALARRAADVRRMLEESGARDFLLASAIREREAALAALETLPPPRTGWARAGRDALEAFADAAFTGFDALDAGLPSGATPRRTGAAA
jgi:geranylgeranyl diphosphate synthase type I